MIRPWPAVLVVWSLTSCATEVTFRDEPPAYNDPDAPIACPAGSMKRIAANTYRELDPVRLADAKGSPPSGYVPPRMLAPPQVRYPGNLFSREPGFVSVFVVITPRGSIEQPRIVCSSGVEFEQSALDSIPTVRISPAAQDGVPMEDTAIIPIEFAVR